MKTSKYLLFFTAVCLVSWSSLFFAVLSGIVQQNTIIGFIAKLVYFPHILILFPLFEIYKKIDNNVAVKRWFIVISIGLFLNDISWYFITYFHFNITNISLIPFVVNLIPFFTWVIASIVFLIKLLNKHVLEFRRRIYTLLILFLIDTVVILLFLSSMHYASGLSSLTTLLQVLTFIAQVIVFDFVILCLIYTESIGLFLFLSGVVILISGDFFIIYSTLSKTNSLYVYGELLWFLGLLFNMFGAFAIEYKNNYDIKSWVRRDSTIKGRLILWCFNVAIVSFLFFFIIAYSFSIINKTQFLGLPLFIMIYSIIVVALFSYVGKHFEEPFKQIENNVKTLMLYGNHAKINNNFSTDEFVFLQQFILEAFKNKEEKDKAQLIAHEQEKTAKTIKQMMHDITSPIQSINTIVGKLGSNMPENDRVTLRNAAERISGIAQRLISRYEDKDLIEDNNEILLISLAILQMMNEKREEYIDSGVEFVTEISKDANFSCIKMNIGIFKRMLSNLINNAVDALAGKSAAQVIVKLSTYENNAILILKDNGSGMPEHIQEKFKAGVSVTEGKGNAGHGIGLTQVRDAINAGNGKCTIYASEKFGTTVNISFPKVETPLWLATEIKLTRDDTVIILDDDDSIHGAWDSNFAIVLAQNPTLQIKHFTDGDEVVNYINQLSLEEKQNTFLLTDFELLDQSINGLEVIKQTNMHRAILVTSYSNSTNRQSEVQQAGIKMLPKELSDAAAIIVDKKIPAGSRRVDMVWVEDQKWWLDHLVTSFYNHLTIDKYNDPISFMADIHQYPLDTRIILDTYYELPDGTPYKETGLDLAEKLHAMGFTKLILYAGEAPDREVPEYLQVILKLNHKHEGSTALDKV